MALDLLDDEFIWNLARIVRVSSEGNRCNVTVRYEGWGSKWDIELPYPNERLARMFTYTRQVRCFAILLGSSKVEIDDKVNNPDHTIFLYGTDNWTNVWPCKVSFRMPHQDRQSACAALRMEDKVYIKPYMTYALPGSVRKNMIGGGQWVETSRLLPWKDLDVSNPLHIFKRMHIIQEVRSSGGLPAGNDRSLLSSQGNESYSVMKDFCVAYQTALSDWVQGRLPPQALSEGVLLNDAYRIFPNDVEADPTNECRYSGSFAPRKMGLHANRNGVTNHGTNPQLYPDTTKIAFTALSLLPSPVPIIQSASPDQCIRQLEASNLWAGVLHVAGNDIFVGAYASQIEARRAVQLASAQLRKDNCQGGAVGVQTNRKDADGTESENAILRLTPFSDCDSLFVPSAAHTADLFNTTAESVVSAFEKTQQSTGSDEKPSLEPAFHLQEWIGQHYRHIWHGMQLTLPSGESKCDANIHTRRKQTNPKRLQRNLYL
jgi:hypothetical protein